MPELTGRTPSVHPYRPLYLMIFNLDCVAAIFNQRRDVSLFGARMARSRGVKSTPTTNVGFDKGRERTTAMYGAHWAPLKINPQRIALPALACHSLR